MTTFLSRCSTTLTIATLFLVQLVQIISATTDSPLLEIIDSPVLDMDGKPVETTSQYYIIPATPGFIGGLRLKRRPEGEFPATGCPEFVYRSPLQQDFGLPVKFIPTDPAQTDITFSTELKISFASPYLYCPEVWSLTPDKETDRLYVSTGVLDDNRNCKVKEGTTLNATFEIKMIALTGPYAYIITYSPPPPILAIDHLALFSEDGTEWLGVSDSYKAILPVYFKKLSD